ncbi:hypothetical protein L1887_54197 [Cichorium endivia]|nr:hypothetical protein L1887_54197 [Cichorium endivia]
MQRAPLQSQGDDTRQRSTISTACTGGAASNARGDERAGGCTCVTSFLAHRRHGSRHGPLSWSGDERSAVDHRIMQGTGALQRNLAVQVLGCCVAQRLVGRGCGGGESRSTTKQLLPASSAAAAAAVAPDLISDCPPRRFTSYRRRKASGLKLLRRCIVAAKAKRGSALALQHLRDGKAVARRAPSSSPRKVRVHSPGTQFPWSWPPFFGGGFLNEHPRQAFSAAAILPRNGLRPLLRPLPASLSSATTMMLGVAAHAGDRTCSAVRSARAA